MGKTLNNEYWYSDFYISFLKYEDKQKVKSERRNINVDLFSLFFYFVEHVLNWNEI